MRDVERLDRELSTSFVRSEGTEIYFMGPGVTCLVGLRERSASIRTRDTDEIVDLTFIVPLEELSKLVCRGVISPSTAG